MKNHPLINTLLTLRGNPRACVYTEPLWCIPHYLYIPFVSVYMSALFLTDSQIGLVASATLFFMAVFALLSGAITDKLGRKKTTIIFDILSWSVPCLIWAFSQNFWWFMVAAAFNGMMHITTNSWMCLLVEDAEKSAMVRIFSIIHVIAQMAVIFAPISAALVSRFSVVPVMRGLYLFAFVSMTVKFIILYKYCDETEVGKVRKSETADMSIFKILSGYGQIFKRVLASPSMMLALAISVVFSIVFMIMGNFFALYTTGNLLIPAHYLAYYPILRSLIVITFLFVIQPRISRLGFKLPMLAGVMLYVVSHGVLLIAPVGNLFIPFVYIFIEACAYSLVMPNRDSIVVLLIEPDERARISSIITVLTLCCSIPFGYFAGWLSDMDRRLPFALDIALFALVFAIICIGGRLMEKKSVTG